LLPLFFLIVLAIDQMVPDRTSGLPSRLTTI
jgi:hypothetical protein